MYRKWQRAERAELGGRRWLGCRRGPVDHVLVVICECRWIWDVVVDCWKGGWTGSTYGEEAKGDGPNELGDGYGWARHGDLIETCGVKKAWRWSCWTCNDGRWGEQL